MGKTRIEWVKNPDGTQGYTSNPITGCLNDCTYCYARKLANGRLKDRYLANGLNLAPTATENDGRLDLKAFGKAYADPFYPRFWPEKLEELHRRSGNPHIKWVDSRMRPRGIFVCDMSDLFGIGIPEDWTLEILEAIRNDPIDRFYLLTKQPQRLRLFRIPDNCWIGVTVTDATMLIDAFQNLSSIRAKVKYLSIEPLLEQLNGGECEGERLDGLKEAGISWVVIGQQTPMRPETTPKAGWIREIVEAADKAGVKVFLKNSLRVILPYEKWCYNHEPPQIWKLRQEMPKS